MQSFLTKFRTHSSKKSSDSSPLSNPVSGSSEPAPSTILEPETDPTPFAGVRKIHPNPNDLISMPQSSSSSSGIVPKRGPPDELGFTTRVPAALARVANRKIPEAIAAESVPPTLPLSPAPLRSASDTAASRRTNPLSLLSSTPFGNTPAWSTFGRARKEQALAANTDVKPPGTPRGATVSRTSSQSRPTTATKTPPSKGSPLSRNNSTSVKQSENPHSRIPSGNNDSNDTSLQNTEGIPSTENQPVASLFNPAVPPSEIDATYPPRTHNTSKVEGTFSSLPFTFGRQGQNRPHAEAVFTSDFGEPAKPEKDSPTRNRVDSEKRASALWSSNESAIGGTQWPAKVSEQMVLLSLGSKIKSGAPEPFPTTDTPSSEHLPAPRRTGRAYLTSDSSAFSMGEGFSSHNAVPSLVTDLSQDHLHPGPSSSSSTGENWMSDPLLRNMPSSSASMDELGASNRQGSRIDPRIRRKSASASTRKSSLTANAAAIREKTQPGQISLTTVFPAGVPSSFDFNKDQPVPSTSAAPPTVEESDAGFPALPALAFTGPTPRPSSARLTADLVPNIGTGLRVPERRSMDDRTRKISLKVAGKRKASEEIDDPGHISDDRGKRPPLPTNVPSSYHRKKMRLSNPDETDVLALRPPARRSNAPSLVSGSSAHGGKRPLSRNESQTSIPLSAILTPRAPSVHRTISNASRISGGRRIDPLKNRAQRPQPWVDTWALDREEMPLQAWFFFGGFLLPLFWWLGVLLPIPRTRKEGEQDGGKPELWAGEWEQETQRKRMWRWRCLWATIISTLIYVPVIACAVVFSRR